MPDLNGGRRRSDPPNVPDVGQAIREVAAHGIDENRMSDWLCRRIILDDSH